MSICDKNDWCNFKIIEIENYDKYYGCFLNGDGEFYSEKGYSGDEIPEIISIRENAKICPEDFWYNK